MPHYSCKMCGVLSFTFKSENGTETTEIGKEPEQIVKTVILRSKCQGNDNVLLKNFWVSKEGS